MKCSQITMIGLIVLGSIPLLAMDPPPLPPITPEQFAAREVLPPWNAFASVLAAFWFCAFGLAMMTTDMSFRRHGPWWILRLYLRTSAVIGVIALLLIYMTTSDQLTEGWRYLIKITDTSVRWAIVASTLTSATIGVVWFFGGLGFTIGRICRYLRQGPPWMPWDRELDRQIDAEFKRGQQ